MTERYTIGLDYGSLSCRGVLVNVKNGAIAAEASLTYPHGFIDQALPNGTLLPPGGQWCLQHPADYELALTTIVPQLMTQSGIRPEQVVGIGVDFTASTVIPVDKAFRPLCYQEAYASRPHAWCKKWKHHGASLQAELLNQACQDQHAPYLAWYGGRINSECLTAKVAQVFMEDRDVYDAADAFVEAGDYITSLLAGQPVISTSIAAAKALWSRETGYPSPEFLSVIDPAFSHMPREKLADHLGVIPVAPGERASCLCPTMAKQLGLLPGIAVTASQMDAYTPMLGVGIDHAGAMLMVIGTSTAIMLLGQEYQPVQGVTACLPNTYYPGLWGYASGQASVGDAFRWFTENHVPESYHREARQLGLSLQQYLTQLAQPLKPGETGLLALDWFNGNKSCLGNSRLSGMILGLNLQTRPEEIYRALLEATAFGARRIIDAYREASVPVEEILVCGGIPGKNPLLMQIYADVLGLPLKVSRCTQAPALGAAIYAAAAAGSEAGFNSVFEAVQAMHCRDFITYTPCEAHRQTYDLLYQEYLTLHDYFGQGGNRVMERLRR